MTHHFYREYYVHDQPDFLATGEAGRLLGLSPSRVVQLANVGELSVFAITAAGRVFLRRDVELLVEERERRAREHGDERCARSSR